MTYPPKVSDQFLGGWAQLDPLRDFFAGGVVKKAPKVTRKGGGTPVSLPEGLERRVRGQNRGLWTCRVHF